MSCIVQATRCLVSSRLLDVLYRPGYLMYCIVQATRCIVSSRLLDVLYRPGYLMPCVVQAHPGVERMAASEGPSGGGGGQPGSRCPLQQRHAATELPERPREENRRPRRQQPGPHLYVRRPVPHSQPLQNHSVCLHAMVGNFLQFHERTHTLRTKNHTIVYSHTLASTNTQKTPYLIQNDSSHY